MKRMGWAVVVTAVGVLLGSSLSGCGEERADGGGSGPGRGAASGSASPTADPLADHDRRFRKIAGACAEATGSPSPSGSSSLDPEAGKYVENQAFRKRVELGPDARCRADAHAKAVLRALRALAEPLDERAVRGALERLGYPVDGVRVVAGGPWFSLAVPDSGLCVTVEPGPPPTAEGHGVYYEGGCERPRGGH
ncbi:hypothetical protein JNUCC64_03240 [Streptomyces sp. JNUCC 64]